MTVHLQQELRQNTLEATQVELKKFSARRTFRAGVASVSSPLPSPLLAQPCVVSLRPFER